MTLSLTTLSITTPDLLSYVAFNVTILSNKQTFCNVVLNVYVLNYVIQIVIKQYVVMLGVTMLRVLKVMFIC